MTDINGLGKLIKVGLTAESADEKQWVLEQLAIAAGVNLNCLSFEPGRKPIATTLSD